VGKERLPIQWHPTAVDVLVLLGKADSKEPVEIEDHL